MVQGTKRQTHTPYRLQRQINQVDWQLYCRSEYECQKWHEENDFIKLKKKIFQEADKILNIFAMFIVIELASTFRKKEIINYLRHI